MARLPERSSAMVLDLGCGTGDLAFGLLAARQDLQVTGLDISAINIAAADARRMTFEHPSSVTFIEADFLQWQGPRFHSIVADSVLHLIVGDDHLLAMRLAVQLNVDGTVIATMPLASALNGILMMQRRLWRLLPRFMDRFALAVARIVYPREQVEVLAARVGYLRLIPERWHGKKFTKLMASAGLDLIEETDMPSSSFFKPRHRLLVFRRTD